VLFLLTAVRYAFYTSFSYFAFYDDEGYMMITVQGYLGGHPLYNDVFTLYGPFYYFYEWFLHSVLSIPLTHDFTRVVCIFHWLAAASVLAVAGGLMTRSLWVGSLGPKTCKTAGASTLPQMPKPLILGRKASSECEQKAEQKQVTQRHRATPPTHGRASACWGQHARGGAKVSRKPLGDSAVG